MAVWRPITLQDNLLNRYYKRRNEIDWLKVGKDEKGIYIRCKTCGQPLYVGDKAWSHFHPRRGGQGLPSYTVYYDRVCYKRLWI